ncbi:rRNA maturation RNase YbeY [Candidatus Parcubacteria bacterium]|nr:rRNA maturation RNase YbeY [Candidatus Parcubacteria bacterium]
MIEINNLTTNSVDEKFLKKTAKIILKGEAKKEANVSIAFVGQGRMREINKRYRDKNRVTDVLSFPESKVLLQKFKVGPTQRIQGLGEIIICLREVKKNAKKFNSSFKKELNRVLIHGILHLLGYDHEKTEEEAKQMEEKEKYYLSKV